MLRREKIDLSNVVYLDIISRRKKEKPKEKHKQKQKFTYLIYVE